jgi:hypothetical protein
MEDPASTVFDDEKTVQDLEPEGCHREEVHGRNGFAVITQKQTRAARVARRRRASDISRDATFRDLEAEFEKVAMNPGSTPGGILFHHPLDQRSKLGVDSWPAKAL